MVATDRISAFDNILKNKITDKGAILPAIVNAAATIETTDNIIIFFFLFDLIKSPPASSFDLCILIPFQIWSSPVLQFCI